MDSDQNSNSTKQWEFDIEMKNNERWIKAKIKNQKIKKNEWRIKGEKYATQNKEWRIKISRK